MRLKSLLLFSFAAAMPASAYVLDGQSWTLNRTVVMQASLNDEPHTPFIDGSTSFDEVAQAALDIWNLYLPHLDCTSVANSPVDPVSGDDEMSLLFDSTVFGDKFGPSTLAVTLINYRGAVMEETDTVFNNAFAWNSYRGVFNPNLIDFRRVAIHEFGHSLGLGHPDENGQHVTAIMNSHVGNVDTVQADDIAGATALYGTGPAYKDSVPAPVLANISTRALVGIGDNVLIGGFIIQGSEPATVILRAIGFSLSASGFTNALFDPMITVYDSDQHQIANNDDWAFTGTTAETISSYHLDPPNSRESALYLTLQPGAYTAIVQSYTDSQTPPTSGLGLFELYDLHTTGGRAGNISTRGQVLGGDNLLIGGFIVGGTESKTIVARAIGPSLINAGVPGALSNPSLELRDGNGDLVQSNDNWQDGADADLISEIGLPPSDPNEAALLASLNPGNYTALVSGVNGATGIGLVEVYDTSPVP